MESLTNTWQTWELPPGPANRKVELDMGCGKGRFTTELAHRYPERLVICNDVMSDRLRILEKRSIREGLSNIRVLRAASLALVAYQLPAAAIDRLHLLCPDPWPKKAHLARRLVCTDFLCRVARILKPGGVFHLSTDYTPYFEDWKRMFAQLQQFYVPFPEGIADVADIKTDFELHWNAQGLPVQHVAYRVRKDG